MTNRGWIKRNTIIWHKPNCLNGGTKKGIMPSTLKDLARLKPDTVKLWDGEKWNKVILWIENKNPQNIKEIKLRSGEKINCTENHIFMVNNKKLLAKNLKVGDILDNTKLPDNNYSVELIPDDIGWLIGLYIAEGSRGDKKRCLQFASHTRETERYIRLKKIAEQYDETCTEHITSNKGKTINIYSKILSGIINSYVSGNSAHNKHLTNKAWRRNNIFLKNVLKGYLSGDGHWDIQNKRWRIGFTRKNSYLANDLRTICARLNINITLHKNKNAYQGEIRFSKSKHLNCKNRFEIIKIFSGKKSGRYWNIILEDKPNLFSTISGTLIHNCMPASANDRFTVDFEYLFFFTKNNKAIFWTNEKTLECVSKKPLGTKGIEGKDWEWKNNKKVSLWVRT